jgi:hypothetical protein
MHLPPALEEMARIWQLRASHEPELDPAATEEDGGDHVAVPGTVPVSDDPSTCVCDLLDTWQNRANELTDLERQCPDLWLEGGQKLVNVGWSGLREWHWFGLRILSS